MVRKCVPKDFSTLRAIINDAANAYKGVIPPDCWHDPYMSEEQLARALEEGVEFWGIEQDGDLAGVMGLQRVRDVELIRHAYVRTSYRNRGIGSQLLSFLLQKTNRPVLVGAWAAASWAIRFYEKHGFQMVSKNEKDRLLKKYWSISDRQIETSVVLADRHWREARMKQRKG